LLKSLEVPQRRWDSISMDFIVGLPRSSGYDSILVVVDRLTKMAHFISCTTDIDSEGTAKLFRDYIFKLHGLPSYVVSDRGPQFRAQFLGDLYRILKVERQLSTAHHPQTDGQTERVNQILEQYLRGYCNYQQDNWFELLSLAEFAYNNTLSSTIGM